MNVEQEIALWVASLSEQSDLSQEQIDELTSHLMDAMSDLMESGLSQDEAYLIAVRRMGSIPTLTASFVRKKADRIWKDLFQRPRAEDHDSQGRSMRLIRAVDPFVALLFVLTAVLALLPTWFGSGPDSGSYAYALNVSFMVIPSLAFLYLYRDYATGDWSAPSTIVRLSILLLPLVVNLYPFEQDADTLVISAMHLPLASWMILSAFRSPDILKSASARLDYIRFSGETAVYGVLVGLATMALVGLTMGLFGLLGFDLEPLFESHILPLILPLTLFVGVILVEQKRSLVENFAPVLARVIAPLLLLVLGAFTIALLSTTTIETLDRDMLLLMDMLLLGVVMVVIYSVSTRSEVDRHMLQDVLSLLLVVLAMISDGYALAAMIVRISEFGFTPNKVAAMGANILLFGNLIILALYFLRQIKQGVSARDVLVAQGWYFVAYQAWFYFLVLIMPLWFAFS
jgi:hypothetical protein